MLIIEYDPNKGYIFPDGEAEEWANKMVAGRDSWINEDEHIMVCSTLLIDLFRALIPEGKLAVDEVEFRFNGQVLEHNKYGRITHWPDGFCSIPCDVLERLLSCAHELHKKEKNKI